MKKQSFILLLLITSLGFSQSALWKISGNGLTKPSYLFGTIHLQNKSVFELNDSLLPIIERCDLVALELDLPNINPMSMVQAMMLPQGEKLSDLYSNEEFSLIKKEFELRTGLPIDNFLPFRPFMLMTLIMLSELGTEEVAPVSLDEFLSQYALLKGTQIEGIETLSEQMEVIKKMPNGVLLNLLEQGDSLQTSLDEMLEAYETGDILRVAKIMREDDTYGDWQSQLIDDRNKVHFERTLKLIESHQQILIAVGMAHLADESGLIAQYKARGYIVEPIVAEKTFVSEEVWSSLGDANK